MPAAECRHDPTPERFMMLFRRRATPESPLRRCLRSPMPPRLFRRYAPSLRSPSPARHAMPSSPAHVDALFCCFFRLRHYSFTRIPKCRRAPQDAMFCTIPARKRIYKMDYIAPNRHQTTEQIARAHLWQHHPYTQPHQWRCQMMLPLSPPRYCRQPAFARCWLIRHAAARPRHSPILFFRGR